MDILKKLYELKDMDQLVEEISFYLKKAIIIENNHFELISYSSPSEFSFDPIQQKTILAKRCPLYVIERLKKEGIIERLTNERNPIRLNRMEDIDFYERVVISLKVYGKQYGYLWLYETEQLTASDLIFLTEIAPHLADCLYNQHYVEEDAKQRFIWKLMNDDYLNEAEVYQAAKKIAYSIPDTFTVAVYSVKDAESIYVLGKVRTIFSQMNVDYYHGKGTEIIGIINNKMYEKPDVMMDQVRTQLTESEVSSLYLGIGDAYNRVSSMRSSYLEALEVIETMVFLNVSEQTIFHFRNLGLYRYMKLMYKKNVSEQYRNDILIELMNKDFENKSELLKTLWYFLQNDCKVAKTAEALYIHPNTLNYRMKQITQLVDIDFTNMEKKMEWYIELMLIYLVPDYYHYYTLKTINNPTLTSIIKENG